MTIYSEIDNNRRRTWVIIALFILLITTVGFIFGKAWGDSGVGLGVAFIISGLMSFGSYYFSDSLVLTMSGAKEIGEEDRPDLFHIVQNLCIGDGLPVPKIYIIDDTAPNAFASGRDPKHAVICVTSGILDKLDHQELEGVIAHELSHIKNYDTRLMSIVVVLVGVITLIGDWFLRSLWWRGRDDNREGGSIQNLFIVLGIILAVISPITASLMQLALSRRREFLADANGAYLTRYPDGLARALEKISRDKEPLEAANNATAHLFIVNPFKGKDINAWFSGLFDTHPPVEERIKALRSM